MKSLAALLFVAAVAVALPADPQYGASPFFNIKVQQQHADGVSSGYGATISKTHVNLAKKGPYGEEYEEEPFVPHRPPFLALPPVREYKPVLPPAYHGPA